MERQPLGHWVRTCDHHNEKRYMCDLAPLPKDEVAFRQLTGERVLQVMNYGLYLYGPRPRS